VVDVSARSPFRLRAEFQGLSASKKLEKLSMTMDGRCSAGRNSTKAESASAGVPTFVRLMRAVRSQISDLSDGQKQAKKSGNIDVC
jgi:hypothetical protein